jgi:transcriptional regulator with XRE-family HTH domain
MIDVDRIRLRRLELRLTQADLGKAIQQDQAYISKIERGQVAGMTVAMLERIALALHVDVATLIKAESEPSELLPTLPGMVTQPV